MPADDVEKLLAEQKAIEDRRKQLIEELMKQRSAAIKEFDDKLAKLGYNGDGAGKPKRSHHKKPVPAEKAKA
ncbi:MAG: hypothetical protein IT160_17620 [Bryobacterales bacterium]|nr:hypothetical protein [Bryobacterales bacterium]